MNKNQRFSLSITALAVIFSLVLVSVPSPRSNAFGQSRDSSEAEKQEQAAQAFLPAKQLLLKKNMPFDPEMLHQNGWQRTLAPILSAMPEMQDSRRYGPEISGLLLGDTLYFPEKVTLVGDTVILAKNIIFEGQDVVIKGNFPIYIYPLRSKEILGTSLETAVRSQFSDTAYKNSPFSEQLKMFVPEPVRGGNFKFTISVTPQKRSQTDSKKNPHHAS